MRGFRIGRAFGIPIEVNASWIVIFALILWSLSAAVFPATLPGRPDALYWTMGLGTTLAFFGSLLLHELAHSLVSRHYGLEVRRIVLFIFGGVSEATAEMPSAKVEFWVGIAGPLMSLFLGALSAGLAFAAVFWGQAPLAVVFQWLAIVNVALAVFNLLPGFPLDGGRVLRAAAWKVTGSHRRATRIATRGGQIVAGLLFAWALWRFVSGDLLGGVWVGFLGYLLFQAAGASYGELVLKEALSRVGVRDLMSRDVQTLHPAMTLRDAVDTTLSQHPYGGYPVADGHLQGILQAQDVQRVPAGEWPRLRVSELMRPLDAEQALGPETAVSEALERFSRLGVERLPVLEDGELVGILSQSDVMRYLSWHPEMAK